MSTESEPLGFQLVTHSGSHIRASIIDVAQGRAVVLTFHTQEEAPPFGTVMFSAEAARQIAAQFLNMADDIDGNVPLVFFPRDEDDETD